jgi:hypothetical protein
MMTEGQEVMEINNSPTFCQPTKAVLAQICMGVFLIRSVSDTIITMLFLLKPPSDRRGQPDEAPQTTV